MQLVHLAGGDNAFDIAVRRTLKWAFRGIEGELPDLRKTPMGSVDAGDGLENVKLRWWSVLDGPHKAVEIQLLHPDEEDRTLQWRATATVSESDGTTRATIRLARGTTVQILRPSTMSLRAPGLATDLMKPPLLAYVGTLELTQGVRRIEAADADDFVADTLLNPGRTLPVAVLAHDVPQHLARQLARGIAGLALVTQTRDDAADARLQELLRPRGATIPRHGLRLYWPGFGDAQDKLRHPYWTRALVKSGPRMVDRLVKLLAPISTGRVPIDPAVMGARREQLRTIARATIQQAQPTRRRPKTTRRTGDSAQKLEAQIADLETALKQAEKDREDASELARAAQANELKVIDEALQRDKTSEELRAELATLRADNAMLRENLKTIAQYKPDEDEQPEAAGPDDLQPDSWDDVREHIEDLEGPGFQLTENALKCANGKARYPHPDTMWESLCRLERVGRAYNELGADLGVKFEDFAFTEGGIEVALHDSTYENACGFEFEGEPHSRLPHVKVDDAKSPNEVGRIYFALDSAGKRLIVDWFGTKEDRPQTGKPPAKS